MDNINTYSIGFTVVNNNFVSVIIKTVYKIDSHCFYFLSVFPAIRVCGHSHVSIIYAVGVSAETNSSRSSKGHRMDEPCPSGLCY